MSDIHDKINTLGPPQAVKLLVIKEVILPVREVELWVTGRMAEVLSGYGSFNVKISGERIGKIVIFTPSPLYKFEDVVAWLRELEKINEDS